MVEGVPDSLALRNVLYEKCKSWALEFANQATLLAQENGLPTPSFVLWESDDAANNADEELNTRGLCVFYDYTRDAFRAEGGAANAAAKALASAILQNLDKSRAYTLRARNTKIISQVMDAATASVWCEWLTLAHADDDLQGMPLLRGGVYDEAAFDQLFYTYWRDLLWPHQLVLNIALNGSTGNGYIADGFYEQTWGLLPTETAITNPALRWSAILPEWWQNTLSWPVYGTDSAGRTLPVLYRDDRPYNGAVRDEWVKTCRAMASTEARRDPSNPQWKAILHQLDALVALNGQTNDYIEIDLLMNDTSIQRVAPTGVLPKAKVFGHVGTVPGEAAKCIVWRSDWTRSLTHESCVWGKIDLGAGGGNHDSGNNGGGFGGLSLKRGPKLMTLRGGHEYVTEAGYHSSGQNSHAWQNVTTIRWSDDPRNSTDPTSVGGMAANEGAPVYFDRSGSADSLAFNRPEDYYRPQARWVRPVRWEYFAHGGFYALIVADEAYPNLRHTDMAGTPFWSYGVVDSVRKEVFGLGTSTTIVHERTWYRAGNPGTTLTRSWYRLPVEYAPVLRNGAWTGGVAENGFGGTPGRTSTSATRISWTKPVAATPAMTGTLYVLGGTAERIGMHGGKSSDGLSFRGYHWDDCPTPSSGLSIDSGPHSYEHLFPLSAVNARECCSQSGGSPSSECTSSDRGDGYPQNAQRYLASIGSADNEGYVCRYAIHMADDTTPGNVSDFFYAIDLADSTASATSLLEITAPTSTLAGTIAAYVAAPDTARFVVTSATMARIDSIRVNQDWTGPARFIVGMLQPGTYHVGKNGVDQGTVTADADGAVTFTTSSASPTTITLGGHAAPPAGDTTPPSQPEFEICPTPTTDTPTTTAVTMRSTLSVDDLTPPVQYQFVATLMGAGQDSSPWQSSRDYTDTGIAFSTACRYYVHARDALGNTTGESEHGCVTTPAGDGDPPAPAPNFVFGPGLVDDTTISMVWSSSVDATPPVTYYVEEMTNSPGADDSGWTTSTTYTDEGLAAGDTLCYRVLAQDALGNQTAWSDSQCVITPPPDPGDTEPPHPDPGFLAGPVALDHATVRMISDLAIDDDSPPVYYQFVELTGNEGGTTSGWQTSRLYDDTGLQPNTLYRYTVQARDSAVPPRYTAVSAPASVTTPDVPLAASSPILDYVFSACYAERPDSARLVVYDPTGAAAATYDDADLTLSGNCYLRSFPADSTQIGQWRGEFTLYYDGGADSVRAEDSYILPPTPLWPTGQDSLLAVLERADLTFTSTVLDSAYSYVIRTHSHVLDALGILGDNAAAVAVVDSVLRQEMVNDLASLMQYVTAYGEPSLRWDLLQTQLPVVGELTNTLGHYIRTTKAAVEAGPANTWAHTITSSPAASAGGKLYSAQANAAAAVAAIPGIDEAVDATLTASHDAGSWGGSVDPEELADLIVDALGPLQVDGSAIIDSVLIGMVQGRDVAGPGSVAGHGTGDYTGGAELGGGLYVHVIDVRHVPGLSVLPNARVTILSADLQTRYVDALTNSAGIVTCHLDAGTYWAVVSQPALHDSEAETFAVSGSGGVTTIELTGLAIPAPGDPLACSIAVDTMDLFGVSVDSIEVAVTFEGTRGFTSGGAIISPSPVRAITGIDQTGRAVLPLIRSSEITAQDDVTTYTFRFRDLARSRRNNPYRYDAVDSFVVPDSTTARFIHNLPE